jgi:hypothetical protein
MTNEEAKAVLIEHRRHELNQSEIGMAIDVAIQALSSQVDGGDMVKEIELLNNIIEATPCDPDITEAQLLAWKEYHQFINDTKFQSPPKQ